jgi:hypothetical protein
MPDFSFELGKSPDENINEFFKHLKDEDHDFASILEEHLGNLVYKLNDDRLKQQARKDYNNIIIKFLDK